MKPSLIRRNSMASDISPHFGGGSGLKLVDGPDGAPQIVYLPSLRWGERIETPGAAGQHFGERNLPSLRWGERIETRLGSCDYRHIEDLPSLRWGERIETRSIKAPRRSILISPHFGGGSGLKLIILSAMKKLRPNLPSLRWGERIETCRSERTARCCRCISPHFGGGSGLKLGACDQAIYGRELISPHFGGGSGLKLPKPRRWIKRRGNLPSLRWGERIETYRYRRPAIRRDKSPLTSVGGAD